MPDPETQETKTCKACGVEKPVSSFYKAGKYLQSSCKACDNARRTGRKVVPSTEPCTTEHGTLQLETLGGIDGES